MRMNTSRSENSKKNIIAGIANCMVSMGLGFIARTAVLYVFDEMYLGAISVFSSVISVLNMAELGFSTAITVSMCKPLAEGNDELVCALLAYYRKVCYIIGSLVLLCGMGVIPWIPQLFGKTQPDGFNVIAIYALYLIDVSISYFLFAYKTALLIAAQRFDIVKNIQMATAFAKLALQIIALILIKNFYVYVILIPLSTVVSNLAIASVSEKKFPQFVCCGKIDMEQKTNIHKRVGGLAIGKIACVARNSFDTLILSVYFGLKSAAVYNNYFYIYNAVIAVLYSVTGAVQASVADSIVSEGTEKNYKNLKKFEFIFGWLISWCTSCLVCLYQPFMKIWAGDALLLSTEDMILFCLYFYCIMINIIRNLYFDGNGLWWKGKKVAVYETLGNLVLNLILGKILGITGILLATVITIFLFNYIGYTGVVFREYFRKSPEEFYRNRIAYTLVTIAVCIASAFGCQFIKQEGIVWLLVKFLVCSLVTNGLLICLYYKNGLFLESYQFMKKIFLKK